MKKKLLLTVIMTFILGAFQGSAQGCIGFKTYSQGGWGTGCAGNNPGCYRDAHFSSAFPAGATIGCGSNTLTLTTAAAVQAFLPSGTAPSALPPGAMTDPGSGYHNVLAAQLLSVVLNVGFDNDDPDFGSNPITLGTLVIVAGPFQGKTVNEFIVLANAAIGGCGTTYSFGEFNAAATAINENFDNGTVDNGYLNCEAFTMSLALVSNVHCFGEATGEESISVVGGTGPYTYTLSNGTVIVSADTTVNFSGLIAGDYTCTVTDFNGNIAEGVNSFSISQPLEALSLSIEKNDATCYGGNGQAIATVTGGVSPYSYSWNTDPAQTEQTANLPVGFWTLTVTDANGCQITGNATIILLTCDGFQTFSQGGYGTNCNGNNPGCYRDAHFASAFPSGVIIGLPSRYLEFTSAAAIRDYLPSGTAPRALTATMINPTSAEYRNILSGQALTLALNIGFDISDPDFSSNSIPLGSLIVNSGVFAGQTVNQLMDYANIILSGGTTSPVYSASAVNDAVDSINNNYENGNNQGYLSCPCTVQNTLLAVNAANAQPSGGIVVYPNPVKDKSTIEYSVNADSQVSLNVFNVMGQLVKTIYSGPAKSGQKYRVDLISTEFNAGIYFIKLNTDKKVFTKSVIISK